MRQVRKIVTAAAAVLSFGFVATAEEAIVPENNAEVAAAAETEAAEDAPVDEGVRLLMVERDGCIYCKRWREEIMPAYFNSIEGRVAPLARIDINGPWPDGLALARKPRLTPTFILLRDGTELDRMEGYSGDIFFWTLLDRMMESNL